MKKGITLAILSVIILVMVILATAATITGSAVLNDSKKIKFGAELALVQDLVDEYAKNNNGEYPVSSSVSVDLSNVTTNSISQFDGETKNGTAIMLYEVDFSLLTKTNLTYGTKEDETDMYAVSKDTGNVYYLKGVKVSGITYYTLTDDLKEAIGYVENVDTLSKDGIMFTQSTTKWTNQNITSTLKVPNSAEYTGITVSVMQNGYRQQVVEISETLTDYKVYNISGINGNYDIQVAYTKNGDYTTQYFTVTNFDNVSPKVTVTKKQGLVNEDDGVKEHYISLDIVEDISGIKYAKYETENITTNVKQYFASNGMNISNNTITANKYTKYVTIYVEDKAGNFTTQVVTLDVILSDKDYVRDGLVLQYDGINNTGNGHSNSARVWKDLSGKGNDVSLKSDNSFDSNSCTFKKTVNSGFSPNNPLKQGVNGGFTIECIAKSNTTQTSSEENFELYDWFWNIRDDSGSEKMMQFVRSYTGNYNITVCANNTQLLSDRKAVNAEIASSQLIVSNTSVLNYFNGVLAAQGTSSNLFLNSLLSVNNLDLGYAKWSNTQNLNLRLNGNIYIFRIYNRALTEKEVMQNYKVDKLRYGL